MSDQFQSVDPIPRELGRKVEEPQWMTPEQANQVNNRIFETSLIYDLDLWRRTIERDGYSIVMFGDE